MMKDVDVACINDIYYVNIDDFKNFLDESIQQVKWWCEDVAPEGTQYVVETLAATKDFLVKLKEDSDA